ncbi:hypothetical protein ORV05_32270 [Amycolatopsis cynarae]|uniref:AlgX/AlgJ SGNH hydrolase-like domain-containing protein n=1 Tax=Amycolatopsis cynarae TaxID=2995223 RepID=A0ABY7B3X2_9PSEU|nr:hypothetical protein [Amycolatopsis sp. HUAS 11-8]WAL65513.1 hypothetical protein ORV05_32270 [Amycolatopsis sp. HUAS 11-8]
MKVGTRSHPPGSGGLPPTPESWLPKEHNLYRPRHSLRQRTALVSAIVFFLVPALAFVVGVRPTAFENRALHGFPPLGSGWAFFTGLSAWATDQLPLRQAGVEAANGISTGVFGDPPGSGRGSTQGGPTVLGPQDQRPPTPPAENYPPLIFGSDGWIYLGADVSNKCAPTLNPAGVVRAFQRLRAAVESSGRRFELIIAPDKSTELPEHLPASYPGRDCSRAVSDQFWRDATQLGNIDLRPSLAATTARVGHPLYDPNDTHWNYEGGLTMAYALAERLQPGITASWMAKPGRVNPWPADLPPLIGKSENRHLQTYSLAPDGTTDRSHYVASDFRTPLHLQQNTAEPGKGVIGGKVALIADSFTQFASPFLAAAFQDVSIVHAETMAANPTAEAAQLLADRDTVVVELAERNAAGGASPLLEDSVIDQIAAVLANNPR